MTRNAMARPHQDRITGRPRRRAGGWAAAGLAALLVLSACSGSGSDESATAGRAGVPETVEGSQDDAGVEGGASDEVAAPDEGEARQAGPGTAPQPGGVGSSTAFEPRRISRGEVTVEVSELDRAAQQVRDLAVGLGGYVSDETIGITQVSFSTQDDVDDAGHPPTVAGPGEARLTLRLPPAATADAMNEIATVGKEVGRWRSDTEVELTLVDLESRIATQTRSVQEITALMDRATTLSEIVDLEREVSSRTAELESLKSRQATVAGQAEMSTVTAVLRTTERVQETEGEATGFLGGLASGWDALQRSAAVLLTAAGALLPFAVVAALVGYPLYRVARTRSAARAARGQAG